MTKIRNVDELRQRLLNVWSTIEQDVIDASIDQWRVRLKACVRSGGRHFEHMLLCLIYVNNIGNAVPYQAVKLFADDTNLFVFGDSLADIENQASNCVCALNNWFVSNKLSLNLSKTCFMIFSPKPVSKQLD